MKGLVENYKKGISSNRKKYQDGLLFLKHFFEQAVSMRENSEKGFRRLVDSLKPQVPGLEKAADPELSYTEFLKVEAQSSVNLETEQSDEESHLPDNKLKGYKIGPDKIGRYN